jgi:DNA mismatch repair ATPase MutS
MTISEKISELSESILGTKLSFSFSAVNNVQLSPLEETLLEIIKTQAPEIFEKLTLLREENRAFDFDNLIDLRDEILFFTGYIEFAKKYESLGYIFSFAETSQKDIYVHNLYDISLAIQNGGKNTIVTNDIEIKKGDIFIVSGANQGGKTTFLRAFGQCILFAAQGLPVPAEKFSSPFFDLIATHFNRAEKTGSSRFEDEIHRIKYILSSVSSNSLILLNECFSGTRRSDAVIISEKIFKIIFDMGATCGFVTHFFELPMRDNRLISFTADIVANQTAKRTYRIVKRNPEGLALASSIVETCGATYEQLLAETI